MFERELRDLSFINRWSIVRTLRQQNIAEHSFYVAMYANDICVFLSLSSDVTRACLQYALWHDVDEIFTSDLPGPNKRDLLNHIGPDAKSKWDDKISEWEEKIFKNINNRNGGYHPPDIAVLVKLIVKVADWMDAAIYSATEVQMGNTNVNRHMKFDHRKALDAVDDLCRHLGLRTSDEAPLHGEVNKTGELRGWINTAVGNAAYGVSNGPTISQDFNS